jgi:broad specificity phosphatase PhoE/predicted kinase
LQKLYVAMVGLPARGKSTLARRIRDGLAAEGIAARIFNNGELRRALIGPESTEPDFYNQDNAFGRQARENICLRNMELASSWLAEGGQVAILDATNASRARRKLLTRTLREHPLLFIECVNEDPILLNACIERKADLPEYAGYSKEAALQNFKKRIGYYEAIYEHLQDEQFRICVDSTANRIINEKPCEGSPYYPAIREILVTFWVHCLYLARHGETAFNVQGRIGGDPPLTARGRAQAKALAEHLRGHTVNWVFTSTRMRSHETAAPLLATQPGAHTLSLTEFDEISAGDCENMLYEDIRQNMPDVAAGRSADKYNYAYPNGESYAMLSQRVQRGLQRALFLADDTPIVIVGHQAVNRVLLALFLRQRTEDIPYIHIPQNQYYRISLSPREKIFKRTPYYSER